MGVQLLAVLLLCSPRHAQQPTLCRGVHICGLAVCTCCHRNSTLCVCVCMCVRVCVCFPLQVRGDELVAALRRQSRGPVSTTSSFRGVTKHAKGKWEARIGRGAGAESSGSRKYM